MRDLIDRQAAIDAINDSSVLFCERSKINDILRELPSAQTEIIRCKDCKWWDKDTESTYGYCMAMKHGYMSANWEIGIYRRYKGNFYCADAERRTDDT